jgi:Protein of unknown function (DUF2914)
MSGTGPLRAWKHLAFFTAGFVFDAFMIRRIDDEKILIQQGLYLLICGGVLAHVVVARERAHRWSSPVLHFMLGTLLNAYALFYVKSGSGLAAVFFLAVISMLLLVNELPSIRRRGPVVLYGLYSFCLTSYFAYLYPVLIGRIRWWMFVLAVMTAAVPLALVGLFHHTRAGDRRQLIRQAAAPALAVQALLLLLYALGLIPPVPLSLMEIGIYHDVARQPDGSYQVRYVRPAWYNFWTRDDSEFRAQPGDRVYTFFRVFAPRGFHDEIRVAWFIDQRDRGWTAAGNVPIPVTGGRENGYAGVSYKQSAQPGRWRVVVTSIDGREIGRRTFSVESIEPSSEQRLKTETR